MYTRYAASPIKYYIIEYVCVSLQIRKTKKKSYTDNVYYIVYMQYI